MALAFLRRHLASRVPPASPGVVLRAQSQAALRIEALLRVAYVFPIYWFATHVAELRPLLHPAEPQLRWPVAWLGWVGLDAAPVVLAFGVFAALLGALTPSSRIVRILVFLGLLQVLALKFSFGKVHHLMHGWLFATFLWCWLPRETFDPVPAPRVRRQMAVLVFSASQVAVALTYSLAGLGKLVGTLVQIVQGQLTPLHPTALARHLADRLTQTYPDSLLGDWMIRMGGVLWPLMLGTIYLQLFALVAAFRPRLHRWWGFGLAAFHATTVMTLTIDFNPNILLLGILFIASPLAPRAEPVMPTLRDLPLLGYLVRRSSISS